MYVDCSNEDSGLDETGDVRRESAGNTAKNPTLLTAKEAADLCKISESMFRKLHKQAKTPRSVSMGNLKRWISTEIEAWIVAGCPENTDEKRGGSCE